MTLFDRAALPVAAAEEFSRHARPADGSPWRYHGSPDRRGRHRSGAIDAIVLGAAITAGPEREAADPESILQVNLLAQVPILTAARRSGVRRVVNLSSAAAYGTAAFRNTLLDEETACDPASLYAITKFASEKVAARLAALWPCRDHQRAAERACSGRGSGRPGCATR